MAESMQQTVVERALALPRPVTREPLGAILQRRAGVPADAITSALDMQRAGSARIGEILCATGALAPEALADALAYQHGLEWVDLAAHPPDPDSARAFDPVACLRAAVVPAGRIGGALTVATAHPENLAALSAALPAGSGPVRVVFASAEAIRDRIAELWRDRLAHHAETRCPAANSCRVPSMAWRGIAALLVLAAALLALAAPWVLGGLALGLATLALLANTGLKLAALLAGPGPRPDTTPAPQAPLPTIALLVPLLREAAILPALIARLERLDYPRALVSACLVVESDDRATRAALEATALPPWIEVVAVPAGRLRTKPRALNYALEFISAEIVGVYDAEDAPAPDQLRRVAARFAADDRLACLQGTLDFYNGRANWIARCFTIEYAVWFRVVLRGLARRGLPFPLGGTTLFLRRDALQAVGGWDAHNVTEDADLGIRLARFGHRCDHIDSVTLEEAACRPMLWMRQRARWLKGFAITWATHMRRPKALWRDLGPTGFLAFQALFLGALAGFLLAPALWSFWLIPFLGAPPLAPWLPADAAWGLFALLLLAEGVGVLAAVVGLRRRGTARLAVWLPALHAYYPMATLAAWHAVVAAVARPFHWAKTPHGVTPESAPMPPARARAVQSVAALPLSGSGGAG
jgi:cellulose synthase/poly-beta-1,6-N-acetylglucosamine synthase-like glycosyltransferase